MERDRNCLFLFIKLEFFIIFIIGGFLQKFFIIIERFWGSVGVKFYGRVKFYLLFKKKVFGYEVKMLEVIIQFQKGLFDYF